MYCTERCSTQKEKRETELVVTKLETRNVGTLFEEYIERFAEVLQCKSGLRIVLPLSRICPVGKVWSWKIDIAALNRTLDLARMRSG